MKPKQLPALRYTLLSLSIMALTSQPAVAAPAHVLMVVVDDLGFSDLGYKAATWNITGPLFYTPTIDSLAANGVKLESYYVHFLCSPSRTAMLSGRYAYTIGGNNEVIVDGQPDQLPTNIRTTADLLKLANYSTAAFGKWDAGMTSWGCTPNCRGFDRWAGYYGADEDYYLHNTGPGVDFRLDFEPYVNQSGVYSTNILTSRLQEWVTGTVSARGTDAPTFAYLSFQAIHAPQQVPPEYLAGYCMEEIPDDQPTRQLACGQMRAVDEALANITATYQSLGILDNTVIIFTTDNGGNTDTGGSNWPLRGIKATLFEGGVRGASFVTGAGLAPAVRGTVSWELYSLVDWLPTIVHGIAGVDLAQAVVPKYPYQPAPPPLDGVDVWASISQGTPSPRTDVLLSLQTTTCYGEGPCNIPGAGAVRSGQYKLIHGHVGVWYNNKTNCTAQFCGPRDGNPQPSTYPLNVTKATSPPFCPTGWVPPPGSGLSVVPPPDVASCHGPNGQPIVPCRADGTDYLSGGTWLFDVVADPTEQNNLAASRPDIVAQLMTKLQTWNATNIPQSNSPADPASDPSKFGGVWTPWRGDPVPQHCDPNVTAPGGLHSNFDGVTFANSGTSGTRLGGGATAVTVHVVGWAWDGAAPDGGRAPLNVTVTVDGTALGTCVANFPRPGLVPKTGAPDPDHGFIFNMTGPALANVTAGKHAWHVTTDVDGRPVELVASPVCYCDMAPCKC